MLTAQSYLFMTVLSLFGHARVTTGSKLMVFLLDGFRWDYFDQPNVTFPGFKKLFDNGIRTKYTTVDFPSLSIPNYYTLMTGLHVENHGMVGNNMYNEQNDTYFFLSNLTTHYDPAWWKYAEPLWVAAEKQDKRSYMFYWPGCDVAIRGTSPTFCESYFYGNGTYSDIPEMADSIYKGIQLFKNDSADLVGIFTETIDAYGHSTGPNSPELIEKLVAMDGVIGQLMDNLTSEGLTDDVTVMIFSDHGMTEISPARSVNLTDYIDLDDLKATVLGAGPICSIWPKDDKIDKVYNDLVRAKEELGHFRVFKKNDIPDEWHYKNHARVAPIITVAEFRWFILQPYKKEFSVTKYGPLKGYHGYDPQNSDMRGIFVATGPGIKKNVKTKPINTVDIYQLMCHVLGIKPSANDGIWSHVDDILADTSSVQALCSTSSLIVLCSITLAFFTL